ncbi:hypothetical protein O7621_03440 [Solwaraspora sp. WMMD937]|uniref:hypothetical protein n=1 Tax=Solwaraspora sp. WMMD937 TaxID=3016090 RepID=UPI00249AA013|nr:hypothetical protein [Solwaraspora sp. WMMD937]WFE22416.1 hypothetical protein O7621_03440 [Solwaraspora sp. WMMD937]
MQVAQLGATEVRQALDATGSPVQRGAEVADLHVRQGHRARRGHRRHGDPVHPRYRVDGRRIQPGDEAEVDRVRRAGEIGCGDRGDRTGRSRHRYVQVLYAAKPREVVQAERSTCRGQVETTGREAELLRRRRPDHRLFDQVGKVQPTRTEVDPTGWGRRVAGLDDVHRGEAVGEPDAAAERGKSVEPGHPEPATQHAELERPGHPDSADLMTGQGQEDPEPLPAAELTGHQVAEPDGVGGDEPARVGRHASEPDQSLLPDVPHPGHRCRDGDQGELFQGHESSGGQTVDRADDPGNHQRAGPHRVCKGDPDVADAAHGPAEAQRRHRSPEVVDAGARHADAVPAELSDVAPGGGGQLGEVAEGDQRSGAGTEQPEQPERQTQRVRLAHGEIQGRLHCQRGVHREGDQAERAADEDGDHGDNESQPGEDLPEHLTGRLRRHG